MYKIMNNSKRSFIVKAKDVLKGGEPFANKAKDVMLSPGKKIYEVTEEVGKNLATYDGIVVVEHVKEIKTPKVSKKGK